MSDNQPSEEEKKEAERKAQEEKAKAQGGEVTTPVFKCAVCGGEFESEAAISAHSLRSHRDSTAWKKKEKVEKPEGSVYKGEVDEKELLHKILDNDPDLSQKHIDEVIRWSEFSKIDPFSLTHLLTTMKDVKQSTATRIGFKYQAALNTAMGESPPSYPMFLSKFQEQGGANILPRPQQYPWQEYRRQGQEHFISKSDVMDIVRSYNRERELGEAKRKLKEMEEGGNTSGGGKQGLSEERLLQLIDERERRRREEREKNIFIQTLDNIGKTLENLNTRISTMEHGGTSEGSGKKKGDWMSEERLLQLIDQRDEKRKEEVKESALVQTLDGVRQALDNLNVRVSTIEQGGSPKKHGEGEDSWNKKILNAAGNKLINLLEKGEATEEKLRAFAKELKPSLPPGARTEFDMRVEQAQCEAEARKIEAEEKRKGYEAIAGGIRDGLGSLGWNIGAGASAGPTRSVPSSETQTEVKMSASEPQPMEWKDGFWYTRCAYPDCRAPMSFEDGKSTVTCPTCNRVIQVQPTEEELRRKVSAEKIKAEAKREKPKREKPQKEKPQREESQQEKEKPPEAEKLEGVEEKPSAEAKPEEKSKGELSVKAAETAEGVAA